MKTGPKRIIFMKWQDFFELVEVSRYAHGGHTTIGGDPDLYNQNPTVYKIRNKGTQEFLGGMAAPKYTAEYYANKAFNELGEACEMLLLEQ